MNRASIWTACSRARGVYDKLEEMGVQEGDFVVIGDLEFEYVY